MTYQVFRAVHYHQDFWLKVYIKTGEHEADTSLKVYEQIMLFNKHYAYMFWSQCFFEDFNQFYNSDKAISYADKSLVLYKARF